MASVPKPPKKTKKGSSQTPKLTEGEQIELAENLSDALEFESEITITTFRNKKYEKFTGVIRKADPHKKMITFVTRDFEQHKISANLIVGVQ
ncbi:YolD-like family protein [Virgibacillus salexigens]|uniref:YolD-like family protein n=1 Tax=Virgibacillus kapii TaxID=1638645 RepID=A0ABQ2DWT2_9BACI|nr:YolD-like family protein [Virgibacillus kapii]GGJ76411.1 hypothetical protein GCM10007111_42510 [Virgibacillus kapii]